MILALNDKRNPKVVLWEPAMANHCGAAAAEPGEYERRVVGWFIDHESAANRKSP